MAAVEQYARLKKLNPGTSELLRRNALNHFLNASTDTAFMNGKLTTLREFARTNPAIAGWIEQERIKGEAQLKEFWRVSALHAYTTLVAIHNQNLRKAKRGNPGLRGIHPTITPEAAFIEILDAQAISKAKLTPSRGMHPANIREKIRPVVKDFMARGLFCFDIHTYSNSQAVDMHTRRVNRKFDAEEKLFQSRRRPSERQDF